MRTFLMRSRCLLTPLCLTAAFVLAGATGLLRAQAPAGLPDGPGANVVRATCLSCHESDLIRQQRLARAGWVRELEKMGRWGAVLPPAEQAAAAEYLATQFGASRRRGDAVPAASAGEPGQDVLTRRCLGCHQADLIEQQRLAASGWTRELEKMGRWGATLPDAERDDLLRYLSNHFGPTR